MKKLILVSIMAIAGFKLFKTSPSQFKNDVKHFNFETSSYNALVWEIIFTERKNNSRFHRKV
jgi:hypothetical protein